MTFIASVVAKKGVAVIADSLVTSITKVIEYKSFIDYIKDKSQETPVHEIKIDPLEIVKLFKGKTSHTKDYEEKLFMYDRYTAVTTAGTATINEKRIEYIIREIVEKNRKNKGYNRKRFKTKIKEFCEFINKQAIEHLNKFEEISSTTFIFTHYEKNKENTEIYKIDVLACNKKDIKEDSCIRNKQMNDSHKVVCDGQNRISERILWGEVDFFFEITPKIVNKVIEDLKIDPKDIPADYVKNFLGQKETRSLLPKQFFDDMKVNKLAGLSLQQAVDLAYLLMKIEINFQKYTENIPTVGGVIKLAVIDKDGFRFISGNNILKPENIN